MTDIDIDVANHDEAMAVLPTAVQACQINNRTVMPHISGVYLQKIPVNPLNNLAAFPYKHAEKQGFMKLDLLTNHVYKHITSQDEIRRLMKEPIDWEWFKNADFVASLFQFSHRWAHMVAKYEPQSIIDLACLLAIIRPGKTYLIGQPWANVREKIWIKEPPERGETFKKSHSFAYALVVGIDARRKAPKFFDTVTISESQSQSVSCALDANSVPPD